jgi:hypothetical protein
VIQRFATPLGGGNENLQVLADLLLADEVVERLRAQGELGGCGTSLCRGCGP